MDTNMNTQSVPAQAAAVASSTYVYGGFWERVAASFLDGLILFAFIFVLALVLGIIIGDATTAEGISYMIGGISYLGYVIVYQNKTGQTIGKKAMHLKVVNTKGETPSMMTFFLREIIGKWISGIILDIGYLMVAFDSKKQGLHDKIAGTYVIKV